MRFPVLNTYSRADKYHARVPLKLGGRNISLGHPWVILGSSLDHPWVIIGKKKRKNEFAANKAKSRKGGVPLVNGGVERNEAPSLPTNIRFDQPVARDRCMQQQSTRAPWWRSRKRDGAGPSRPIPQLQSVQLSM